MNPAPHLVIRITENSLAQGLNSGNIMHQQEAAMSNKSPHQDPERDPEHDALIAFATIITVYGIASYISLM